MEIVVGAVHNLIKSTEVLESCRIPRQRRSADGLVLTPVKANHDSVFVEGLDLKRDEKLSSIFSQIAGSSNAKPLAQTRGDVDVNPPIAQTNYHAAATVNVAAQHLFPYCKLTTLKGGGGSAGARYSISSSPNAATAATFHRTMCLLFGTLPKRCGLFDLPCH